MKPVLVLAGLGLLLSCASCGRSTRAATLEEDASGERSRTEPVRIEAACAFEGYADRPTVRHRATIPVARPSLRYGLFSTREFLGGNWRPGPGEGFAVAIGIEPLRDDAGQTLEAGRLYHCFFVETVPNRFHASFVREP